MCVLTHGEILKRIKKGDLKIDPFDKRSLGPASYDLHLGDRLRVFWEIKKIFKVTPKADYEAITELVKAKKNFLLMPGQTVHGITLETITLPTNLCGWIEGRSRFGRLGLVVHLTSGFIQPGSYGKQVLELNNLGPIPLSLNVGLPICQIVLQECRGKAVYRGKFKNQKEP